MEIEKEAQRLQYLSEKKSHKDIKEKASDSIKLVKNLLKQKNELQTCLEEGKSIFYKNFQGY
jgi:DNA-binding CsgD family transcriptional regulator